MRAGLRIPCSWPLPRRWPSPSASNPADALLPPVARMRQVAEVVAIAVAEQAQREGFADSCDQEQIAARVRATMWEPVYKPYRRMA